MPRRGGNHPISVRRGQKAPGIGAGIRPGPAGRAGPYSAEGFLGVFFRLALRVPTFFFDRLFFLELGAFFFEPVAFLPLRFFLAGLASPEVSSPCLAAAPRGWNSNP